MHHFSAGGLYNGLVLLIDDETRTYWDHITGRAVHGRLAGAQLDVWPTMITTVAAALERCPDVQLSRSRPSLMKRIAGHAMTRLHGLVKLPPGFRKTMGQPDDRLPEWTHGLGVVEDGNACYYPMESIGDGIEDPWGERILRIGIGKTDHVPFAEWEDGVRPMQLFSRWYGFSYTFAGCRIYKAPSPATRPRIGGNQIHT